MRALRRLRAEGIPAFVAGGAVRDMLLGEVVADVDIAVAADSEALLALFPDARPMRNAVRTVVVASGEHSFEVTPLRGSDASATELERAERCGPCSCGCWRVPRSLGVRQAMGAYGCGLLSREGKGGRVLRACPEGVVN